MNRGFIIAYVTVIGFAVGVFAGAWMQRHQPMPAPPGEVLGELRDMPLGSSAQRTITPPAVVRPPRPEVLAQLTAASEAFKKRLEPIKAEFRSQLEAMLSPKQLELLKALSEKPAPMPTAASPATPAQPPGEGKNKTPEPRPPAPRPSRYDGFDSVITIVVIPFTHARFTEELGLDEAQQEALQTLLLQRRAKFLALVDSLPPPSVNLGKVAPTATP
jgi:hypothetical protein